MNSQLEVILPVTYQYKLVSFEKASLEKNEQEDKVNPKFSCVVRANITTQTGAEEWLKDFEEKSYTNFRVLKTFPSEQSKVLFKKVYRCHNNTRADYASVKSKRAHKKHTNCTSTLSITVKNRTMKRSMDPHLKLFPCEIKYRCTHNHPIKAADALRHRKPLPQIKEKFKEMFQKGYSPSAALSAHKLDLQQEMGETYLTKAEDGAFCPNLQWCFHLYYSLYNKHGVLNGEERHQSLSDFIQTYNDSCGSTCAISEMSQKGPIIAVCSPLMKQVHLNLKECSEIMFVDSSRTRDNQPSKVFLFLTPSLVGKLPVGFIICYSESEEMFTKGLHLLKSILPERSFYGAHYPNIIMTDDLMNERNSLRNVFPSSKLLLCQVRVLQAFFRYLWTPSSGVNIVDRSQIFNMFKKLVYEPKRESLLKLYENILKNSLVQKYPAVKTYLKDLNIRIEDWSLAFRCTLSIFRHNTSNYVGGSISVLKDFVFNRTKTFTVEQLLEILITRLESHFQKCINDVITDEVCSYQRSRYSLFENKIENLQCTKKTEHVYEVFHKITKRTYICDMSLLICSCRLGINGCPCEHQYAVVDAFDLSVLQYIYINDQETKELYKKLSEPKLYDSESYPTNLKQTTNNIADDVDSKDVNNISSYSMNDPREDIKIEILKSENVTDCNDTSGQVQYMFGDVVADYVEVSSDVNCDREDAINAKNQIEDTKGKLKNFYLDIIGHLEKNPSKFVPSCQQFIKNYENLKSESSLISSLDTFGSNDLPVSKGNTAKQRGRQSKKRFSEHNYAVPIARRVKKTSQHSLLDLEQENMPSVKH